jgi:peroxiredoxin
MKSTQLLFFLTFFSLITFGQNNQTATEQPNIETLMNKHMPNFSAKDIKGKIYNSKTFKNKVVFINFWFIGCPPCIQELEQLSRLYDSVKTNHQVVFLSITFDKLKDIQSFISQSDTLENGGKKREYYKQISKSNSDLLPQFDSKIQYPIINSPEKKIEDYFQVMGWPTSFIIDKKGIIRLVHLGVKQEELGSYLFEKYFMQIKDLLAE